MAVSTPAGGPVRILYLDCFSGIAGDMLLGALLDLGADLDALRGRLAKLPLRGYSLSVKRTVREGIGATKFDVRISRDHDHRGWKEISAIIRAAELPEVVRERSLRIFRRLIEAEARIHRIPLQKVHLHEVGAVDAIVDIVGSVSALHELLGEHGRLHVSPLRLGGGTVKMAHGVYPVPPPATAALLEGVPVMSGPVEGELVTPTGAAIVSTLAHAFGPMPPLTISGVGYGAGTRRYEGHPNVLRAILGTTEEGATSRESAIVVECTIDDMNPQNYGFLMDRLFETGALEVFYCAVQMKKNRPGTLVTVIIPPERFGDTADLLFRETTTIGLRHRSVDRVELAREIVTVSTPHGRIRMKVSSRGGRTVQAQPEYEDCRRIARSKGIPLKEIQAAAAAAFAGVAATGGVSGHSRGGSPRSAGDPRAGRSAGRAKEPPSTREPSEARPARGGKAASPGRKAAKAASVGPRAGGRGRSRS